MTYNKNQPESIQKMFSAIANEYDRANNILSLQLLKIWNRNLIKHTLAPTQAHSYLDLCCGTGEIAFSHLRKTEFPSDAYLLDFCKDMLAVAQQKANRKPLPTKHTLHYLQADAQAIPLENSSIDFATMAYGIRNIKDPSKCVRDVLRVLKPGGTFGILELTRPSNPLLRVGHKLYLKTVLPSLGWLITSNQDAYKYLCNSINQFIEPSELETILMDSGFTHVSRIPLTFGLATILIAKKSL